MAAVAAHEEVFSLDPLPPSECLCLLLKIEISQAYSEYCV